MSEISLKSRVLWTKLKVWCPQNFFPKIQNIHVYQEEYAKKSSKKPWIHPSTWPYIFSLNRPKLCSLMLYTALLSWKISTYYDCVLIMLFKIIMNATSNHSNWSSRHLCPPQIQLEGIRTAAVLTKRMNTYQDDLFTKVIPNHVNRTSNQSNLS